MAQCHTLPLCVWMIIIQITGVIFGTFASVHAALHTLYHQTSPENAESIFQTQQMRPGTRGSAGPAIYFAESPGETDRKAQKKGVVLQCRVELGRVKDVTQLSSWSQQSHGFGATSAYDTVRIVEFRSGTEYAVYDKWRVLSCRTVMCDSCQSRWWSFGQSVRMYGDMSPSASFRQSFIRACVFVGANPSVVGEVVGAVVFFVLLTCITAQYHANNGNKQQLVQHKHDQPPQCEHSDRNSGSASANDSDGQPRVAATPSIPAVHAIAVSVPANMSEQELISHLCSAAVLLPRVFTEVTKHCDMKARRPQATSVMQHQQQLSVNAQRRVLFKITVTSKIRVKQLLFPRTIAKLRTGPGRQIRICGPWLTSEQLQQRANMYGRISHDLTKQGIKWRWSFENPLQLEKRVEQCDGSWCWVVVDPS